MTDIYSRRGGDDPDLVEDGPDLEFDPDPESLIA